MKIDLTAHIQILLKETGSAVCLGMSHRKCFLSFSLGMWLKLSCLNVMLNIHVVKQRRCM